LALSCSTFVCLSPFAPWPYSGEPLSPITSTPSVLPTDFAAMPPIVLTRFSAAARVIVASVPVNRNDRPTGSNAGAAAVFVRVIESLLS
jgi:hypothetical protein